MKGYCNVIFNETSFFNTYKKDEMIAESERGEVEVLIMKLFIPEINTDDKEFSKALVRTRRDLAGAEPPPPLND